tara:strand:- start:515 stop:1441 length:927 start_codon:yes stop_codon:yes gene_type:complete
MDDLEKLKIGVVAGGISSEREISLKSGRAVHESLSKNGFSSKLIDINSQEKLKSLETYKGLDLVFIMIHGKGGEDGEIQSILEAAKIKYTGSDSTSSLNAFDKLKSKEIFEKNGLEVPLRMMLQHSPSENNAIVIKPLREGSSFGVSIIKRWWDYKKSRPSLETEEALKEAQKYGEGVLIEKFIEGKELTVAIVGESTYPAIEIISPNEFYDFSAKYDGIGTKYIPANLSSTETKKLSEICLKAFKSLGCSGWGRVDLIKSKNDGILYILEVNTVPGMTETSLVPKAARLAELSFNDLLVEIIKTSID